jgi:hypothetical protein
MSVFAKIAAFFTGGADRDSDDDYNRTYNETHYNQSNESEGGFWADVKAFLRIG